MSCKVAVIEEAVDPVVILIGTMGTHVCKIWPFFKKYILEKVLLFVMNARNLDLSKYSYFQESKIGLKYTYIFLNLEVTTRAVDKFQAACLAI